MLQEIVTKRSKPAWFLPENKTVIPKIHLFNSLTNEKEIFIPNKDKHIEWYSCGPTVYDSSHMGHARAYISIDILRRVMKNFFKFDIHYVMNITDIDDKIIKRARQNYLFEDYLQSTNRSLDQTLSDVNRALELCENKLSKETDSDKRNMLEKERIRIKEFIAEKFTEINTENLSKIKDSLSELLDREKGSSVVDNRIFEELPRFYEADFMEDMKNLKVLPPDELTRVSEYIDKIIRLVEEILSKGFAYVKNGSVYFDTEAFDGNERHYYAKLVPTAYGNKSLLMEGEGVLSNVEEGEKKSENDFALWKCSKPGEPSWNSPWGKGRPGWHIECSAMAGDKCGPRLDIHTGGIDLKFPHHDNELAQSEAGFGCSQWVNYFLHTGHLTISGCKMSKSLKNFITIKEALKKHSARQLRILFLLHSWKETLDYSDESMAAAVSLEKSILDFFFNVEHAIKVQRKFGIATCGTSRHEETDRELKEKLEDTRRKIRESLSDSVDTKEAMFALKELMTSGTNHMMSRGTERTAVVDQLRDIAAFVYEVLVMFGAADEGCAEFGLVHYSEEAAGHIMADVVKVTREFLVVIRRSIDDVSRDSVTRLIDEFIEKANAISAINIDSQESIGAKGIPKSVLDEFLDGIAEFRQAIRAVAIEKKWKQYLVACDLLRDNGLASIGVCLQDRADDCPAIGLMPVGALVQEKKPAVKKAPVQKQSKKLDASVDPKVMFKMGPHEGLYSAFDEEGLPTHDAEGAEVSKNKRGKLKKIMADQEKSFNKIKGL